MLGAEFQGKFGTACTPEAETFQRGISGACVGFRAHKRRIKYLLIVPGLQVVVCSFKARVLGSPDNPAQHFSSAL